MTDHKLPPLPKAGPIGYASVSDVLLYKASMNIGPRLPGVRDVALWTTDQMRGYADAAIAKAKGEHDPTNQRTT